jgi:hypothetical protein
MPDEVTAQVPVPVGDQPTSTEGWRFAPSSGVGRDRRTRDELDRLRLER